jgi:AbrB family looped-hinge helix DNA binding protein
MDSVKVSPKFQVVIPRKARESLRLRPGQRVQVILYDNRLEFIPIRPLKEMRGFLKGIDTSVERERDRI